MLPDVVARPLRGKGHRPAGARARGVTDVADVCHAAADLPDIGGVPGPLAAELRAARNGTVSRTTMRASTWKKAKEFFSEVAGTLGVIGTKFGNSMLKCRDRTF